MTVSTLQRRSEGFAAIALIVLGLIIWHEGDAIPPSFMDTGFGAGLLPKWLGGTVALLSALLLLEIVNTGRHSSAQGEPERREEEATPKYRSGLWKPCVLVLLLLLLLVNAGYQGVPFYISVVIFIFTTILVLEGLGIKALIVASSVSLATSALLWIVFSQLFMVIIQ